jgi:Protein of unknown function (DUF4231)
MPDVFKSMSPEEYMAERLDQYQQWYDKKSIGAKSKYMGMRAASVVGAAIVPVIVNLPVPYASYAATIISLAVVIVVSLESVYHFGDHGEITGQQNSFSCGKRFCSELRTALIGASIKTLRFCLWWNAARRKSPQRIPLR